MKSWEEIMKDKLEGYESTLPDDSLEHFRARRAGAEGALPPRRHTAAWLAATAVAAAGLAAVLFLRQPKEQEEAVRVVPQTPAASAWTPDRNETNAPPTEQPYNGLLANAHAPKHKIIDPQVPGESPVIIPENKEDEVPPREPDNRPVNEPVVTISLPPVQESSEVGKVSFRTGAAAGTVMGGSAVGALVTHLIREEGHTESTIPTETYTHDYIPGSPDITKESILRHTHYIPLKAGLSTRIPVAERLSITTGLEYCLYASSFTLEHSGNKMQFAHYLGIPLRLDWTIASGKWMDVYVGGGVSGDICVGAFLDGTPLKKDGISFSAIGAGGLQFKLSDRLSLYLEPEIGWTFPSESRVLNTYRSEHPLTFSIATGLRINL